MGLQPIFKATPIVFNENSIASVMAMRRVLLVSWLA